MISILLIAVIWTLILDVSGFSNDAKEWVGRKLHVKADAIKTKPLFCSLCMTFWSGLFYLLISKELSLLMLAYLLVISCSTTLIKDVYYLIFDSLQAVLGWLNSKLMK